MRHVTVMLLALCLGCVAGCTAAARPARDPIELARTEGLDLIDPLALDPQLERDARDHVGLEGHAMDRARRLLRWLEDGRAPFRYSRETRNARQAYDSRSGDCFSVTNMFVAFARALRIDARFAYVREVSHLLTNDSYDASSHLAAAVVEGTSTTLVDFERPAPDWLVGSYRLLPDAEAVALFNSNIVMSDLGPHRLEAAERTMRFLVRAVPSVPELESNLAVVLLRRGKGKEALSMLQGAAARYPDYAPIYANGLVAAMRAGDEEAAREFARRGEDIAKRDPVFAWAQGVRFYDAGRYREALEYLDRAQARGERSPLVWTYVVRAEMAAGRPGRAADSFERAWKDHPGHPQLLRLRAEFPQLVAH